MELERRLKKVARYHLALFLLPVLSLLYYGWWKAPELDQRPDNPLRTAPMSRRGPILDRHERPLAHSQGQLRVYPLGKKTGPLIGYHLRGRNQSGLEASMQGTLSPPPPPKSLWGALARDRQTSGEISGLQGPSVVLTLDSGLQSQLYDLFGERAGAFAVATAEGEILAAVSAPSAYLLVVGPDEAGLRADMERRLGNSVSRTCFVGFTDKPEDYIAAADVFCLPSYREGFGTVIIEAAAAGLPAIASRIYGVTDAVAEGRTGVLHAPRDVAAIRAAIASLAADQQRREAMGQAAQERADTLYSAAAITEAWRDYYAQLLG